MLCSTLGFPKRSDGSAMEWAISICSVIWKSTNMRETGSRTMIRKSRTEPPLNEPRWPKQLTKEQVRAWTRSERRVVVQERLSRRHAAIDDPLGDHGVFTWRRAGRDRARHRWRRRRHVQGAPA